MDKTNELYQAYVQILKEELIPAMGCTEPIAIAYAAAKAREVLGCLPEAMDIGVSNNIIKNVKSVIVPNTDGMKGIEAAAAAGVVAGQAGKALEVISEVSAQQKDQMRSLVVEIANHGFSKGFPAVTAMRTGAVGLNGEDVIKQQHALALPVRKIAGGIGVVAILGINLTIDVDERGRNWLRIWDGEG